MAVALVAALAAAAFLIQRAGPKEPATAGGPTTFRRLDEVQYTRSIEDIFGAGIKIPGRFDPPRREDGLLAVGDSRVDPMHARKMAALLQAQSAEDPDATVLLRVDHDAGHGIGKPLDKQVDDLADQYAFLAWRLGLEPAASAMLDRR